MARIVAAELPPRDARSVTASGRQEPMNAETAIQA